MYKLNNILIATVSMIMVIVLIFFLDMKIKIFFNSTVFLTPLYYKIIYHYSTIFHTFYNNRY